MKTARCLVALLSMFSLINGCSSTGWKSEDPLYTKLLSPDFYREVKQDQNKTSYNSVRRISAHEHYRSGASIELYLKVARELGIKKAVFLPTGIGPDNHGYRKHMAELLKVQKKYPDQIVAFATIDEADPQAASILEDAVQQGARGLKLIGGHPHFYDEPLDSPNMYRVYEVVRKHHLPVLIHASLAKFPKQKDELERVLKDFPEVTIVAAHYAKTAPHLQDCQELLDRYPNLFIDISMGGGIQRYQKEICLESKKFRDFIIRNQDRIQWGTDIILTRKSDEEFLRRRITTDFHIFERAFYVDDHLAPNQVHIGLNLPKEVLEKIYYTNPKRIFRL